MVFRAAFRILGHAADAEDVAQEVFLEAVSYSPLKPIRNWGAYLRKLVVFRALDRRRQRCEALSLDSTEFALTVASAHDEAVRRELAEQLRSLIASLPQREGAVFALRYFERLGNSEIAEILGVSIGAVAAAMHKVRAKCEAVLSTSAPGETK